MKPFVARGHDDILHLEESAITIDVSHLMGFFEHSSVVLNFLVNHSPPTIVSDKYRRYNYMRAIAFKRVHGGKSARKNLDNLPPF